MAIERTIITIATCDVCGKTIHKWFAVSPQTGVSKEQAKHIIRQEGGTTGKKIICPACRRKMKQDKGQKNESGSTV